MSRERDVVQQSNSSKARLHRTDVDPQTADDRIAELEAAGLYTAANALRKASR